jgi:long-chain fatty acid transport protein
VYSQNQYADECHYNNILIGDRAAGLGGAYTAISDDPSGVYYNPAGIIFSKGTNLSTSMNAFYTSEKHYDSVLGGQGWERKSSRLLPNFFGVTQKLSKGTIGFSYAVPDAVKEDQDQTFYNLPSEEISIIDPNRNAVIKSHRVNLNNENDIFNFGPSYAREISKSLAIGMTLYFHYRKNERILNQLCILEDGDGRYEWSNLYYQLEEWGIRPVLGFMWTPENSKFSLGFAFSHTSVLDSDIESQSILKGLNDGANVVSAGNIKLNLKKDYPYVFTLGIAYFPSHSLLFSGDITYYTKTYGSNIYNNTTGKTEIIFPRRRGFLNASIGTEYYFKNSLAFRMGMFTNLANTYNIESGLSNQPEHVNMYGGSLSLSYFTRGSSLTIGTVYTYGNGKAQIQGDKANIQNVTMSSLMLFIGASYSF